MKRAGKFGSVAIVVFLLGFAVGRYERTERQQKAVFGIAESMKSIAMDQQSDLRSVAMRPGVYVNRFIGRDGTVYERVGQGIRQRQ